MYTNTLIKFKGLEKLENGGILKRSFSYTDEPKFFHFSCSSSVGAHESSSLDSNIEGAKVKALGEYLERYCLDNPQLPFQIAKYSEIKTSALDPAECLNFRNSDMNYRRDEYVNKLRNTPLSWVKGTNENTNQTVFLPAQLVFVNYSFNEPLMRPRISTGAAAHESFNEALSKGILENIERDAYMLAYFSKEHLPKIKLCGHLRKLEQYFNRYLLELNIFDMSSDIGIPSFMCINIDRTGIGPAVSVGLKASLDPMEGITRSIMESQQVRQWIRNLWVQNKMPQITQKKQIKKVEDRGFYWYGVDKIKRLEYLLNFSEFRNFKDISSPILKKGNHLIKYLADKGITTFSIDITSKKIKEAGFFVVKAIQPQLHPLFLEENFPCLYSKRLEKKLNGGQLNDIPHPFM